MSPAVSPDGTRFAFVQFDAGVPTLYTADIAGGRASAWRKVRDHVAPQPSRRPAACAFASLGPDGQPMPARVYVDASDRPALHAGRRCSTGR